MIYYIIVFCLVLLLTYCSQKMLKKEKKRLSEFINFISIFLLAFLAAVRDDNVGKDITVYVIPIFNWAQKYDFVNFIKIGNTEFGYMFIVYFITKIFNDYHFILFILQFIVSAVIFHYASNIQKKDCMILIIFSYLMLFYLDTYTMMRQYVAMSFILISIEFFERKKYFKTLITYILAILFHNTAIIACFAYFVIAINDKMIFKKINNIKKILKYFVFLVYFISILFYQKIIYILSYKIGIIPIKYYEYFVSDYYSTTLIFSKSILIFKFIWIFVTCCLIQYMKEDRKIKNALIFLITDFMFYIISFKLPPLMRLGYYFSYISLFEIISNAKKIIKNDKANRFIFYTILVILLSFYWYFTFIKNGQNGGTYPYTSHILENLF